MCEVALYIKQRSFHAGVRAAERYGVKADAILTNRILSKIHNGKATLLRYQSRDNRIVYKVRYRQRSFVVVVNGRIDTIITFLPNEPVSKYHR
jgi:hypothetical protein